MKVVIIGGVAGGATAAARLRRLNEEAEIIILERSGFVSYANCGLPYYIGGEIKNKENLTLQTPESFRQRFNIDVRIHNEVLAIDPKNKCLTVKRLEDNTEYTETYDKLILSPGAKALRPPLPGSDDPRIMTLRTVEDTYRIKEYITEKKPQKAAVIGAGFIGLEMAENLLAAGIETTVYQLENQVLPPLDYDMACEVHAYLRSKGLKLKLSKAVEGFEQKNNKLQVLVKDEEPLETDLVIMSIGVTPDTHLAEEAGLALGQKKAIMVTENMETSIKDIYAVGDAVEINNFVTKEKALIALAGPANKQGRIAANNICGVKSNFTGAQASSIIKIFDMTVATTGINEKTAKANAIKYDKVITYSPSHATYYPGATNMTMKTLYNPENGRILGVQIVGFTGVDKRIDVMATAIRGGMTSADLEELDLAYAPPYSSAKDPVNMAGFTIENIRQHLVKQYHWHDIENLPKDSVIMLDTRTVQEYSRGHIPGTVNIPLDELRERLNELDKNKVIYVNCFSGLRSYIACRILVQKGFDCYNLSGGYRFYEYIASDKEYCSDPTHLCGIKIEK